MDFKEGGPYQRRKEPELETARVRAAAGGNGHTGKEGVTSSVGIGQNQSFVS